MRKLTFLSLLFIWLAACADDALWRRHGLPHGGSSNPGAGSGSDEDVLDAFAGAWKQGEAAPGYEAYLVIDADGQGYLCNEDGKSQAEFELLVDGDRVFMGEYGYGEGDELVLQGQGEVVRTGVDHGETYTVRYARARQLPGWCRLQIGQMRRD
jgi:hypothetical protein